ncbi:hypothetical protein ACFJIV_26510 [Mucilaginibacter sp. UC70_90]
MFKFCKYVSAISLAAALLVNLPASAQQMPAAEPAPPKAWHLLDLKESGFYGISLKQAYMFVQGKKSKPVLVATIDSGADTLQTDLKTVLWVNKKEIPGNGIDDDHNGYVDDIHGWNFLGGPGW